MISFFMLIDSETDREKFSAVLMVFKEEPKTKNRTTEFFVCPVFYIKPHRRFMSF